MFKKSRPLRVLYTAGPSKVIGTYKSWVNGQDDPSQVAVAYSAQFFSVCRDLGAEAYVLSWSDEKDFFRDGQFTLEQRPNPFRRAPGLRYHFGQVLYGLQVVMTALRWRADVAVIADGTTHWFVLFLLPLLGVKLVPSIHCALWRKYLPRKKSETLLLGLSRYVFTKSAAILAITKDVADQVREVMGYNPSVPVLEFLPLYRTNQFGDLPAPDRDRLPFRVMFAGRMEVDKGIFDLLEVAKQLAAEGRHDIVFDFCGGGRATEALRQAATEAKLDSIIIHGYCNRDEMRERLGQAHVIIAPTKSTFNEGICKVVVEGVLVGRPVVASAACTGLFYVSAGAIEVQPDDVQGYKEAILKLRNDASFYEQKRQGCYEARELFYDPANSWGNTLKSALMKLPKASVEVPQDAETKVPV